MDRWCTSVMINISVVTVVVLGGAQAEWLVDFILIYSFISKISLMY